MKILIAADGSAYTRHALEFVVARGDWLGPQHEITVLTVVPEVPPRLRAYMQADEVQSYCDELAAAVLDPIRSFFARHQRQAVLTHKTGDPGAVIAAEAGAGGFDLVVMGSHGHTAIGSLVLGSVTAQVLARCTVPLLVVRAQPAIAG